MARFLEYTTPDGEQEYVCLDDVSRIVDIDDNSSLIFLRSNPNGDSCARGKPGVVLMGNIIER